MTTCTRTFKVDATLVQLAGNLFAPLLTHSSLPGVDTRLVQLLVALTVRLRDRCVKRLEAKIVGPTN